MRCGRALDRVRVFGVHDHQRVDGPQGLQALLELCRAQVRELIDTRRRQEALEAEHARLVQPAQLVEVPGDGAPPEADVNVALPGGGRSLRLQRRHVDRGRDAVQRHVEDRRHAARRGRASRRGKALPVGAARLVDMHVGVDEPGQHNGVRGHVNDPVGGQAGGKAGGRLGGQGLDRHNPPAGDPDASRRLACHRDHSGRAQHEIQLRHRGSSPLLRPASRSPPGGHQRIDLGVAAVAADDVVAAPDKVPGHRAAHDAEANESDRGHGVLPSGVLSIRASAALARRARASQPRLSPVGTVGLYSSPTQPESSTAPRRGSPAGAQTARFRRYRSRAARSRPASARVSDSSSAPQSRPRARNPASAWAVAGSSSTPLSAFSA